VWPALERSRQVVFFFFFSFFFETKASGVLYDYEEQKASADCREEGMDGSESDEHGVGFI